MSRFNLVSESDPPIPANDTLPLSLSGGGGTSGGMDGEVDRRFQAVESRLGKVEDKLEKISSTLSDLRVDAARLDERVKHLPTTKWAVGAIVTLLTIITGIVTLAPKLQALVGVAR